MSFIVLIVGVLFIVMAIAVFKTHPFLALILTCAGSTYLAGRWIEARPAG